MKKLFLFLLAGIVASTVFLSCKDKFNEESFLRLQAKLKRAADSAKAAQAAAAAAATNTAAGAALTAAAAAQATALNSAGQLASLSIQVLDDRTPLAGVVVALANTGGTTSTASATTDANGYAIFSNITIGSVTVTLTKTGFATAESIIDLGTVSTPKNYTTTQLPGPNGTTLTQIIPIKQTVSAILPMFANTGASSTATIKGNVRIESDLSNVTFEIPQGLTLLAGLSQVSADPSSVAKVSGNGTGVGSASLISYNFSSSLFGAAAVNNTTGAYTLTVPATAAGLGINVTAPTITANQTLWINSVGTGTPQSATTRVKRTDIPAFFALGGTADAVPTVVGATLNFAAAPASGVGFDFTYAPVAKLLENNGGNAITDAAATAYGNTFYQLTGRGAAVATPPTIAVSAAATPGTTLATAGPNMAFMLTALTTSGGAGYTVNETVTINYLTGTAPGTPTAVNSFTVTPSGGALPTTITVPTNGNLGTPGLSTAALTSFSQPCIGYSVTITNNSVAGTPATLTPTFTSDVNGVIINPGNTKYTTAPTFTFTGSTAGFIIREFKTQWTATPSTTPATTPYKVRPTSITLSYAATTYTAAQNNVNDIDILAANGATTINDATWIGQALTTDGTNIVTVIPNQTYQTDEFAAAAPTITITNPTRTSPVGTITYSTSGTNTGQITAIVITSAGSGYDVAPVITITQSVTGGAGTGFVAPVITGTTDPNTRIFTHAPATLNVSAGAAQGTGYFANLNRQAQSNGSGALAAPTVTVKPGQTYIVNIDYGTGVRSDNVYN